MEKTKKYIDLHIHTKNSDGSLSPTEIVNLAKANNTDFIAICDHDTIKSLPELKNNLLENMIAINGVEFSSFIYINGRKIKLHILGYGFDEKNPQLLELLEEMKQKRINTHINLLNFIKSSLKTIPEKSISKLDIERYCWFDREIIKCMELENYDLNIVDYYKQYFKTNIFNYGQDYELDALRVINGIKSAGGLVVLAHPMAYKLPKEEIIKIIKTLSNMGIDGIEIHQSDCSYNDTEFLRKLSIENNLLSSVGSDFHRLNDYDKRMLGIGINNNLCITETTLTNKILSKKLYYKGKK